MRWELIDMAYEDKIPMTFREVKDLKRERYCLQKDCEICPLNDRFRPTHLKYGSCESYYALVSNIKIIKED